MRSISFATIRGPVLYASPNFFSATGLSLPDEIIGKPFLRLVAAAGSSEGARHTTGARSEDGTLDATCEFRGKRKDGSLTWVEQSTRIIRDEQGKVKEFRNVVRDVTERIRARDELASRERRFRALIEESSDAVCLLDGTGQPNM